MFRGTMLQQIKWNVQEKTELNFPGRDMAELNLIESSHEEEDGVDQMKPTGLLGIELMRIVDDRNNCTLMRIAVKLNSPNWGFSWFSFHSHLIFFIIFFIYQFCCQFSAGRLPRIESRVIRLPTLLFKVQHCLVLPSLCTFQTKGRGNRQPRSSSLTENRINTCGKQ